MKKKHIIAGIPALMLVFALILMGCENPSGGGSDVTLLTPQSQTYTSYSGGQTYTLVITEKGASKSVRYAGKAGDSYTLTVSPPTVKSTGTVQSVEGGTFILQPSKSGAATFAVTISGEQMTAITGTITPDDDSTPIQAPGSSLTLTPPPSVEPTLPTPPTTWTAMSPFGGTRVNKVVYGNGKFVVTGDSGSAWFSTDGIAWSVSSDTSALSTDRISGLDFGGGLFLATGGSSGNLTRAYSEDGGDTWTASGSGFNAKGVAYGNNRYVIGGSGGQIAYSHDPRDGTSWVILDNSTTPSTGFTGSGSLAYINAVAFGNGKFVAGGGEGKTIYSTDGINWTYNDQTEKIFLGAGSPYINGIAYGGGKFVAVGEVGGIAAWSSDGINWTQVVYSTADPLFGEDLYGVAYGNGYFVIVGRTGGAWYSSNGLTWTKTGDTNFGGVAINGVAYGNGKWIIVGTGGNAAYATVTIGD